jgi:hypothetical protein
MKMLDVLKPQLFAPPGFKPIPSSDDKGEDEE